MAPPSRHLPVLMDELIEEILIRLPLDDPAILHRAALVCKPWRRLISGPTFRRRLLKFHHGTPSPPLRGFFCSVGADPRFVPAPPSSSLRLSAGDAVPRWRPVSSLPDRVLLQDQDDLVLSRVHIDLVLWNPIGGGVQRLPTAPLLTYRWNAALLCAAAGGCDHLDCGGHFQVALVGTIMRESGTIITSACIYSSEQNAWSKPVSARFHGSVLVRSGSDAIVGNSLYCRCDMMTKILKYDMSKQELSLISLPIPNDVKWEDWHIALMKAEDGGLGFVTRQDSKLYFWSREASLDNGDAGWVQRRVMELKKMIPAAWDFSLTPFVTAVEGHVGVLFLDTRDGLFGIDLKSGLVMKLVESKYLIRDVVPYVSFCTPASGSRAIFVSDQEAIANVSSAGIALKTRHHYTRVIREITAYKICF